MRPSTNGAQGNFRTRRTKAAGTRRACPSATATRNLSAGSQATTQAEVRAPAALPAWYSYNPGTGMFGTFGPWHIFVVVAYCAAGRIEGSTMLPLLALMLGLTMAGQGCPHEGLDQRVFGRSGCWIQRKLTIENAQPPRKIWSFSLGKIAVKIDPKHPHLLIEWPTNQGKLWRFRAGCRWDANARAYIFPAIAFKKVDGPMKEYQLNPRLRRKFASPVNPFPIENTEVIGVNSCRLSGQNHSEMFPGDTTEAIGQAKAFCNTAI